MHGVSIEVALIPSAPLLIPQLAGPAAHDTVAVREAVRVAGRDLAADRAWVVVGAADGPCVPGAECVREGTTAGFGVAVDVVLPGAGAATRAARGGPVAPMPLSMLVGGWLAGESGAVDVRPVLIAPDATPGDAVALGVTLRELADRPGVGVLVVADGANALSPRAPGGGERAEAWDLQRRIDAALASADTGALAALDPADCDGSGVAGRPAWQVLAGLAAGREWDVSVDYAAAPFGVGYTVARWRER